MKSSTVIWFNTQYPRAAAIREVKPQSAHFPSSSILKKTLFLLAIGFCLAMAYAWSRIKVIELGYEVSRLKSGVASAQREVSLLRSQVAEAKSSEKLAEEAKQAGLVLPLSGQVIFLNETSE